MAIPTKNLKVTSFTANRDMAACLEFSEGYIKILSDQGFGNAYINKHDWMQTEGVFGVLAEYNNEVIGGVMLFVPQKNENFPYEEVTGAPKKKKNVKSSTHPEGTAELFALWHANHVAGWGLSYILLKAGLALSVTLGIKKTLYLAAEFNLRLIDKLGFLPEIKNEAPITFIFQENTVKSKITLYGFSCEDAMFAGNQKMEIKELASARNLHKIEIVLSRRLEIDYLI